MNIYDCFMYFDEDLLLDIRLNHLDKFVNKFVIVEADYTHNGNKKQLSFDINKFKKFEHKIVYIKVEKEPENIIKLVEGESKEKRGEKLILNGMARDYYQRESIKKGLSEAKDEDIILLSDLDEIPNLKDFDFSKINNNILFFEQKIFYYKLNLLYEDFSWHGTRAIKKKNFISPQWLRNIKGKRYPFWRLDVHFSKKKYSNLIFLKNGGWHFTCLKKPEDLEKKLKNFAHHYEFEESGLELNDIRRLIKERRVIYDYKVDQKEFKWSGQSTLKKIDTNQLPDYIIKNNKKFEEWLE